MKKIVLVLLSFIIIHEVRSQTFNAPLATMLQDTLNYYVSQIPNIKGMAAAVHIPGQGIWTGYTGVSHTGQPITAASKMGIASNSKLFVSTIMLKLAERNLINLNDSISKYLPTYSNVNPNIKIRQLLNHTSGVSDPLFVSPWMDTINRNPTRVFTPVEVLSWLSAPVSAPGIAHYYSNVNYIILGMIAKNVTGFHISRLIRDSILTPLNMDSTFYDVEETSLTPIAHRWWNLIDYNDTSRVGLNTAGGAAGSIFSTAAEMVQWYSACFNGQILNQASLNELTTFVPTTNPSYQYGLGLSREKTQTYTYWGHGGSTWGYRSKTIYDSCLRFSVCGLTNCYPSGMESVTFLLYRVVKNHIPTCSGVITGATSVCAGSNVSIYTVPTIANATSYSWTLPFGATGTSSTNSITVTYGSNAVSGTITVRGVNTYGPGGYSTLAVTVNQKPSVGFTVNNAMQVVTGNSFIFTDTTSGSSNTRLWNFGDNTTHTIVSPVKSYSASNVYAVKLRVTTLANCVDSFTRTITLLPNAPSTGSSALILTSTSNNSISLSWTNGNGQRRVVIARANSAVNSFPQNGVSYIASSVFGSGMQLGSGNYVVYKGASNTVTVTGLSVASSYHFAVIELNGDTTLSSYQSSANLIGNQVTLPVKWQSFSANCISLNTAIIKWVTASETNSAFFEVQRIQAQDFNTNKWEVIGKVKGNGNTQQLTNYEFIDNEPNHILTENSSIRYRLRQVDFDGAFDYSAIVKLSCAEQAISPTFSLHPNPNSGVFNINLEGIVGNKTIIISDVMSKTIQKFYLSENSSVVNLAEQGKGIYILCVETENGFYYSKVIVE